MKKIKSKSRLHETEADSIPSSLSRLEIEIDLTFLHISYLKWNGMHCLGYPELLL